MTATATAVLEIAAVDLTVGDVFLSDGGRVTDAIRFGDEIHVRVVLPDGFVKHGALPLDFVCALWFGPIDYPEVMS